MSQKLVLVSKTSGKLQVSLEKDQFGFDLYLMKNGYQRTGVPVNDTLLLMIKEAIEEYFEQKQKGG